MHIWYTYIYVGISVCIYKYVCVDVFLLSDGSYSVYGRDIEFFCCAQTTTVFCEPQADVRQSVSIALAARQSAVGTARGSGSYTSLRTYGQTQIIFRFENPAGTAAHGPWRARAAGHIATRMHSCHVRTGRDQARENLAAALAGFPSLFLSRWV